MGHDHGKSVRTLRDAIKSCERGGSESDREELLNFSDALYLRKSEIGDARHEKLLRHCTIMAEGSGGVADALEDRSAAESIVRWINREYDNVQEVRIGPHFERHCGEHRIVGVLS